MNPIVPPYGPRHRSSTPPRRPATAVLRAAVRALATPMALASFVVMGGVACGDAAPDDPVPESGSSEASGTGVAGTDETAADGPRSAREGEEDDTVRIDMDEYEFFGVPATLSSGREVLRVRNVGFEEHNFEIHRGDSVVQEFRLPLNPGQSRVMELDLEPGDYIVLCTVSGHDGRGMREELTVLPE